MQSALRSATCLSIWCMFFAFANPLAMGFAAEEIVEELPDWLGDSDREKYLMIFNSESSDDNSKSMVKRMDLKGVLSQQSKNAILSDRSLSWFIVRPSFLKTAKAAGVSYYIDKRVYDSSRGFWKEEKLELDAVIGRAASVDSVAEKLIQSILRFNDISDEANRSLSFYCEALPVDGNNSEEFRVEVHFTLWDRTLSAEKRAFLFEASSRFYVTENSPPPFQYMCLGQYPNTASLLESAKRPFKANPNWYAESRKSVFFRGNEIPVDDGLSIDERELKHNFHVVREQIADRYLLATHSFSERKRDFPTNCGVLHDLLPPGREMTFSEMHLTIAALAIEIQRKGIRDTLNVTILPHSHGGSEYTKLSFELVPESE